MLHLQPKNEGELKNTTQTYRLTHFKNYESHRQKKLNNFSKNWYHFKWIGTWNLTKRSRRKKIMKYEKNHNYLTASAFKKNKYSLDCLE